MMPAVRPRSPKAVPVKDDGTPTAESRTLSLYTGKTDIEDPSARDGSKPAPRPVTSNRKRAKDRLR